ncbi:MAG: MSHA biogenesis protein MshE [Betaproteobacteria bacterium RBG_16_64_18]|nr:MAG: MSHA biogenesis protein MshE [Betaproteobacteria bacterium RBG_16_64_18]
MAKTEKLRLGELLLRQDVITDDQLTLALAQQKKSGRKLGRVLVDSGYVSEDGLSKALARQLNIPFIQLKFYDLKSDVVQILPEAQARRFRALVLESAGEKIRVGMADPTDLFAYDELSRILKRDIELAAVTEGELLATFDRIYRRTGEITGLARELTAELGEVPVEFGELLGLTLGQEEAPVVKLLQTVFEEAVKLRASDIHIEPQEKYLRIRFRIDGILHIQTDSDSKIASAVVLRLKLMAGLDISEKRLPQDGRFNIKVRNAPIDVRMSTMPTQHGESAVMRLLNQASGLMGMDRLGMPPNILERVRQVIRRPNGMVLVTGPTGSGKTTTLYAALSEINTPERKIITVEDPVEYRLPNINQVQVHEKIDLSFDRVLRSALRQDPDVILVGEMRDQATAEIGMRAAITGHMVLSTLHTNDAIATPVRLLDMGVPRYMVAMSLQLVLAQRLVRVICESCAQTHQPSPHELEWLHVELGGQTGALEIFRGAGCTHCNGTGYLGRTGVYEMLEMTVPVVEAANQPDVNVFIHAARLQMGANTLRSDAIRLVREGRTTVEEAMRISNEFED